jgi:drug/metabolite transporter (DMT)-like permease
LFNVLCSLFNGRAMIVLLTTITLIAFAANSLLCRAALADPLIDPATFTAIRVVSGALILIPLAARFGTPDRDEADRGSWGSALALFVYAAGFSYAYVSLSTGMGALILFGVVQVTMIGAAMKQGDRLARLQWVGSLTAVGGLVYLVLPGLAAPDPVGALLMTASGIGWGMYSVRGKGVASPLRMTAGNFLKAAPLAVILFCAALPWMAVTRPGALLAATSGAVTSGLGYALWYRTLRGLTTTQASLVQLLVPVIAGFAGVLFLSEVIEARLLIGSVLILGGVAVAIIRKKSGLTDTAGLQTESSE